MRLQLDSLRLTNFRNHAKASWSFDERTMLVGRNTAGKTNVLEALFLLASTKSFRADREVEMVTWGETMAHVEGTFQLRAREVVEARLVTGGRLVQKTFLVNGQKQKTKDVVSRFPMVRFTAEDVRLIDGSPGRRRRALDLVIGQGSKAYHQALSRYNRVLASRNRLIEQVAGGEAAAGELDFWDQELSVQGQTLVAGRTQFVEFVNARLADIYRIFLPEKRSPKIKLEASYQASSGNLAGDIANRRSQDIAVGTTTVGPHRDDWQLLLGNRPLVSFGSGGEYRSAILAFRLAEAAWVTDTLGITPMLLLDDVFSELDEFRKAALLKELPAAQTIITTPEADVLPSDVRRKFSIIPIEKTLAGKP